MMLQLQNGQVLVIIDYWGGPSPGFPITQSSHLSISTSLINLGNETQAGIAAIDDIPYNQINERGSRQ